MKYSTPRSLPAILPVAMLLCGCILGAYMQNWSLRRQNALRPAGTAPSDRAAAIAQRLEEGLQSHDPRDRCVAASVYARMGDIDIALPVLQECLTSDDKAAQRDAIISLAALGLRASPAVPSLMDCLKSEDRDVRIRAVAALGAIGKGAAKAVPALLDTLDGDDADANRECVQALATIGDTDALIDRLSDPNKKVRTGVMAAMALMGKDAAKAIPHLAKGLADDDRDIRGFSAATLGAIGQEARSAIRELEKLLSDEDPQVREAARAALARIRGR